MYKYKPKSVEKIVIRDFSFDFPDDIDPQWIPGQRGAQSYVQWLVIDHALSRTFFGEDGQRDGASR